MNSDGHCHAKGKIPDDPAHVPIIAANRLFGDFIKVSPTHEVAGDMARFMMTNDLTPAC